MRTGEVVKLVVSLAAPLAAGMVSALAGSAAASGWYDSLRKPVFTPPAWLFGPAWTALYLLMGVAAFLVWRTGFDSPGVKLALAVFLIQLILNALWSVFFFGLRSPLAGLVDIAALWLAIVATIVLFFRVSTVAGFMLLPYIGWVTFAAILNAAILVLNR